MATPPERARTNRAATQCDDTGFRGRGVRLHLTRDFVFPAVQDAREFGLTQTGGRMRNQRLASFKLVPSTSVSTRSPTVTPNKSWESFEYTPNFNRWA